MSLLVNTEEILNKICCTCLSANRKMYQLSKNSDVLNIFYELISFDKETYKLNNIKSSSTLVRSEIKTLDIYDETFNVEDVENFVDCGPELEVKKEIDLEDEVPLSKIKKQVADDIESAGHKTDKHETNISIYTHKAIDNSISNNVMNSNEKLNIIISKSLKIGDSGDIKREESDLSGQEDVESNSILTEEERCFLKDTVLKSKTKELDPSIPARGRPPKAKDPSKLNERRLEFKCSHCGDIFRSKNKRWYHLRMIHRGGLQCRYCPKEFPDKFSLEKHHRVHTGTEPREQCTVCKKSVYLYCMKAHLATHEERQAVKCDICGRSYKSVLSYKLHVKKKHEPNADSLPKHKCQKCERRYTSPSELRDHMNYFHLGKTIHKCTICNKLLATARSLKRHVQRHRGVTERSKWENMCFMCGQTFQGVKGLREHERIHSGERPLACELCGATFRQNASLYTHKKRIHKVFPKKIEPQLIESDNINNTKIKINTENCDTNTDKTSDIAKGLESGGIDSIIKKVKDRLDNDDTKKLINDLDSDSSLEIDKKISSNKKALNKL